MNFNVESEIYLFIYICIFPSKRLNIRKQCDILVPRLPQITCDAGRLGNCGRRRSICGVQPTRTNDTLTIFGTFLRSHKPDAYGRDTGSSNINIQCTIGMLQATRCVGQNRNSIWYCLFIFSEKWGKKLCSYTNGCGPFQLFLAKLHQLWQVHVSTRGFQGVSKGKQHNPWKVTGQHGVRLVQELLYFL